MRASISLISSYGMNKNQQNRVKLAAIIELLHTATLVHDDIIDNSDLRRGKTTVNVVWSNSHGVLIGDFIYSKAFMLMNEIGNFKVIDELSSATNKIAEGELMQLANKNNLDTSLQQLKKLVIIKLEDYLKPLQKVLQCFLVNRTHLLRIFQKLQNLLELYFK